MEKAEIAIIKRKLNMRNEDIEVARNQRLKRLEDENRLLLSSLDEANKQNREKQLKILLLTNEGMSLKSLMADLQMKCSEASKEGKLCGCDTKIKEYEKRWRKADEELQSTTTQLSQVEDEYTKLQQLFHESKSAWEKEKMLLMNETSKLLESVNGDKDKKEHCTAIVEEVSTQRHLLKKVEENLSQAHKINGIKSQIREEIRKREDDYEDETEAKKIELQEEIERFKDMLDETSNYNFSLMEEVEELTAHLEKLDSELSDKTRIESELQYELQVWRSLAEYLAAQVDENIAMRRKLEASLLAQADVEGSLRRRIEEMDDKDDDDM